DGEHTYQMISVRANGVTIKGFKLIHSGTSSLIDIAGIKIYDVKNINIENNVLEDTFFGIYLQGATNCTIKNNRLTAYAKT
ncbi:right-handed parallel beta-helix repeat-containing protein, partial [Streptomyces sp. UMAF16]|nr:right-handed parallel beta-helix repeat-containing protein [Streptomyces sp. UMAF16]